MKPTIFLHIGQPKTATTSAQGFFKFHRETLLSQGVLYPEAWLQGEGHHSIGGAFSNGAIDWIAQVDPQNMQNALDREIAQTSPKSVLISTESLFYASIDVPRLGDFFKDYDVEIIVSLRRQDEWTESALRDDYKTGAFTGTPEDYIKRVAERLNYAKVLDDWAQVFGSHKLHVLTFEPRPGMTPPEHDLLKIAGIPEPEKIGIAPRLNDRLNQDSLAWLRASPDALRISPAHFHTFDLLAMWSAKNPDRPEHINVLSPELRRNIRAHFSEGNKSIARTYLDRDDSALFLHTAPISDVWAPYPGLPPERAAQIDQWLAHSPY